MPLTIRWCPHVKRGPLAAQRARNDAQKKYVTVRRFFIFDEELFYQCIQWAVFEPNRPGLRPAVGLDSHGLH